MNSHRRGWRLACVAFAVLLSLAQARAADSTARVALASDVPSLDPSLDSSPIGYNVRLNIYDQLTELLPDGSVGPRLATKWESTPDALTWTFTIRTDVKFQDGSPLTADDVVWTFNKILADRTTPLRIYLSRVKSVEKVGPDKVRFHLTDPFALFDRQATIFSIMPQHAFEAMGAEKFGQTPIGSGPYKVVKWTKDDSLELEAFDGYWRGAPKLKHAILRPIPAEASRAAALISGEVDIVPSLPPALIDQLARRPDITVGRAQGFRVMFLGFNVTNPVLNDLKLRQAIDSAIDRNALSTKLLRGLGTPAGQILPPVDFGYDSTLKPVAFDPDHAKELVKQSGYKGEIIPFQYPNNNFALADEVAQAIAGYLGAVGIKVALQPTESNTFFAAWATRKMTGMYLFSYGSTLYDGDSAMAGMFETGSRIYHVIPEIDVLARLARGETDPVKRAALFGQISKISRAEEPYVYLYNEVQAFGVRKTVTWTPRPDGFVRFAEVLPAAN